MPIVTELKYTTDLDRGVVMQPLQNAFLSGDQEAHRFVVSCFRSHSRQSVDLTGAGVHGYFIRADGTTVVIDGEISNGNAVLTLPAACYARQGRFSLVVKASVDDVIHTILWVEGAISRSHTDKIIDPGEVVPTLDELLAQIAAMEQATDAANEALEKLPYTSTEEQTHYLLEAADIDPTLSENGKVADAGVVGERLANITGNVTDLQNVKRSLQPTAYTSMATLEADSVIPGGYISKDGLIQTLSDTTTFAVHQYQVKAGKSYHITGENVRIGDALPLLGFKETAGIGGACQVLLTGSTTLTDYDYTFTPESDGYLFVAVMTTHRTLAIETEMTLYRFGDIEGLKVRMDAAENAVTDITGETLYSNGAELEKLNTYTTYYINTDGSIRNLAETQTQFVVHEYAVEAGKAYLLRGTASLLGAYPLAGYKATAGTSGICEILLNATTVDAAYDLLFTPDADGYLFIAAITTKAELIPCVAIGSTELDTAKAKALVAYDNVKILSDKVVYCLGDSITYLNGSWAFRLADLAKVGKVYNLGRGGATWKDRGASQINYDENCAIWNNAFSSNTSGATESYPANTDLSLNILPIDNTSYTTISNEIRFMQRLITEYGRPDPDVIVIACGINDTSEYTPEYSDDTFNSIVNTALADMTSSQKSTLPGGLRWCLETIMTLWPDAQVIVSTPIQCAYAFKRPYIQRTMAWIKRFAAYYSVPVIDAYAESGISAVFEKGWDDTSYNSSNAGRYLYDGLHPNEAGKVKMGAYFANEIRQAIC